MEELQKAIDLFAGVWICIILFVTCPLWLVPYIIFLNIKDWRENNDRY